MKIAKLAWVLSASLGLSLFAAACSSEDEEKADSRFFIGDRAPEDGGANKLVPGGTEDLSTVGIDDPSKDPNKPGEYGDFNAEDKDYVDGFGKRITNAPDFAPVYFAFDTFAVPLTETEKVDAIANFLNTHPGTGVVVEGNCDERGTQEYNRALGERRAISVKTALQDRGIAENRIATLSYGEDKPAVTGNDETAWTRNRRADFVPVILNKK